MPLRTYSPLINLAGRYAGVLGPQGTQDALGGASDALGIYGGLQRGGVGGYGSAAIDAGKLAGKFSGNSTLNTDVGALNNLLQIYQGIQRGGVAGYGSAASNGMQLAGSALNNPALSAVGGYIAAPLALYNFANNWKSGATGSDTLNGAETGATIGSVIPGVGTVIGGLVGAAAGALSSAFGPGAKDPETYAVQNVIDATSQNKNNPAVAASVPDPYLELGGLMDRRSSTLPMYQQYGRMGEQRFTNDLTNRINQAIEANPSLKSDPNAVYSQVVAPWVNSMGSGYKNVGPEYSATTQGLLQDMTQQYLQGSAAQNWKAIGGDEPFQNIYQGSPLAAQAQQYTQQLAQQQAQEQAQQQVATARGQANAARGHMAKGGSMRDLYEGSFAQRRRHFDDGGSVGYSSYVSYTPEMLGYPASSDYTPPTPDYSSFVLPNDSQASLQAALQNNTPTTGYDLSGNQFNVNENSNPLGGGIQQYSSPAFQMPDLSGALGGSGGLLSGLLGSHNGAGNWWNGLNTGQQLGTAAGLASLLSSLTGGNSGANMTENYHPAPPAMFQNTGPGQPNPYGSFTSTPRTQTHPTVDYAHYGEGPAAQFFTQPQASPLASAAPAAPTQPAGNVMSPVYRPMPVNPALTGPLPVMARGGSTGHSPLAASDPGDRSYHVQGPGDGVSDSIPAVLSDGEYVVRARVVSALGNGSNTAGARALDRMQENVEKHVGKEMSTGKDRPIHAKAPEAYMKGKR